MGRPGNHGPEYPSVQVPQEAENMLKHASAAGPRHEKQAVFAGQVPTPHDQGKAGHLGAGYLCS